MRKLLCKFGLHSKFTQHDKWGAGKVCRYCMWAEAYRREGKE